MVNEGSNAAFDAEERAILSQLVVDDESVKKVGNDLPDNTANTVVAPVEATATAPVVTVPVVEAATTAAAEPAVVAQGDTRAALRASRRNERRLRDELDQARQENEAMRQGKAKVDTSISDAELAELEMDFPVQAKIVRQQRELQQQLEQVKPAPKQEEFEPASYSPEVQDLIDGVPDLLRWQYDPLAQDKFQRAIAYDAALAVDPDWKDRDLSERFVEAARRTNAAMTPTPASAAPAAQRNDPAAVIAAVPVQGPKGISDFRGGAPANTQTINYQGMSDEQIMASLPMA